MLKLLNIKQITPSQKEVLTNLFTKKIDQYTPSITFLTTYQKKKFEKRCVEENIHKSYEINVNYKYKYDKNKNLFIIYLTKEKAKENIKALKSEKKYTIKFSGLHFKKVCRETLNNNYKFKDVFDDIKSSQGDDNPDTYFSPKDNYWSIPLSKDVNLYKQPTQKTITINDRKRSNKNFNKDFIKNLNIKDKIDDYYPKVIYLSKVALKYFLNKIKKIIKAEKKFGEKKLSKNEKIFILPLVSLYNFIDSKGFIFYLTKTQIKKLKEARKGYLSGRHSIMFSTKQLLKTYKEVIRINSYIYYYNDIGRFYNKKSDRPKLLAITDKPHNKQELLDLINIIELENEEEKDLIDFGDEEEKDLIDFDTIIPNKKPTAQDLLMDEELFPKSKKYNLLQNKDLIPTITNPSNNGVNILKNILEYPETKRILGISLTSDIKEKIENLNSEASFGLASILSSLLTANRGKMSIYSISRKQLKEIIEGFITTLSVILNPAQKY